LRVPIIVGTGALMVAVGVGAYWWLTPAPPAPSAAPPRTAANVAPPVTASTAPRPAPAAARRTDVASSVAPAPVTPAAEPAPTTGTLIVQADVPDAKVFVDRVGVGTAPIEVPNLAPGPHRINVAASGYDSYSEDIDIAPGPRTLSVSFKEVRLDASFNAVHKHGMGSCKGRLSASPAGIRYDAADGKDSVSVAFAAIATFDVDYLAKNLRLATREGKTFNFTEAEGNADRLVAFHRDVDKVRKRVVAE
jgi:hypothetical protein